MAEGGRVLHQLLRTAVGRSPEHPALVYRGETRTYAELDRDVEAVANGLGRLGLAHLDRVGIFLDKQFETATAIFGVTAAGLTFVPINPALRGAQVGYIMQNCNVQVLITTRARFGSLGDVLGECPDLRFVFVTDGDGDLAAPTAELVVAPFAHLYEGSGLDATEQATVRHQVRETDMAGILYTSGSTGRPKGVVFSHRNFVLGAESVAQYLEYSPNDRIINIPPYSFDFGLNQLFSTVCVGATAVLHNFMAVQSLMSTIAKEEVTGVSGVPTVMIQLAAAAWPGSTVRTVRYLSTTGGRMPEPAVRALREKLPNSDLYLMYGLTEAFRSTYLPPADVDRRPDSIGKAIPNAEVLVVRPDGTPCDPDEPGELVHRGPLVTMGYWNDPERTRERFKPAPGTPPGAPNPELAVWSGDTVKRDAEGFIYFVGRRDEMIKTSGYRVSPTEIEEGVFASGSVSVAAAIGVEDAALGHRVVVFAVPKAGRPLNVKEILAYCRRTLPPYMVPHELIEREELPTNPNGKVDRKRLAVDYAGLPDSVAAVSGLAGAGAPADVASGSVAPRRSWAERIRAELFALLAIRRKSFRNVMEVYSRAFPDRPVTPSDSFCDLGGDSLSYVYVSMALQECLRSVPEDWAERPIADLEDMRGEAGSRTAIQPDILLRVVAMLGVLVSHADILGQWQLLSGASKLMLVISGFSFARFNWRPERRQTLASSVRFTEAIAVPTAVFLAVAFLVRGEVDWGLLLFVDNLVSPLTPSWWVGSWYVQNLLQFMLVCLALAYLPGVLAFSRKYGFAFGSLLWLGALSVCAAFRLWAPDAIRDFVFLPVDYFWMFALGFWFAAVRTAGQKWLMFAALGASIGVVYAATAAHPQPMFQDSFWLWLTCGVAYLLWGKSVYAPRAIGTIVVTLARSMLFVYLLHWPLAIALNVEPFALKILGGFAASLALWVVWESCWRASQTANLEAVSATADTGDATMVV